MIISIYDFVTHFTDDFDKFRKYLSGFFERFAMCKKSEIKISEMKKKKNELITKSIFQILQKEVLF